MAVTIIRSPSYPVMPLREAVEAVRRIEGPYRSGPVDREAGAKLIGYKSLSGPAAQALASLAAYGLVERAGKGEMKVTERAKAILHGSESERKTGLAAAALEPKLYRELRERFPDVDVPPEDGVISYLNRQGFNQSAIRPAVKAFLSTISYLKEAGVSDSHGPRQPAGSDSDQPAGNEDQPARGGAKVGDLVQWESNGALCLEKPERVRWISEDGDWVALAHPDYKAAIPMSELIVQERAGAALPPNPPAFIPTVKQMLDETASSGGTDLRFKLGSRGIVVKVTSPDELGAEELNKLVTLLQAQSTALS